MLRRATNMKSLRHFLATILFLLTGCGGDKDAPVPAPTRLPGATLTIVALGDSLTEGVADDPNLGGYPARLQKMLNDAHPGTQVMNLGRSGWTSDLLVKRQLPTAVQIKPQIALVWIGSNDLWRFYKADQEASDLQNFSANLDTILGTLKSTGAQTFIALLDDQSKRPVAHTQEIEPYGQADLDRMSRRGIAYNAAITQKAAQYGATTVDFYNTTIFTDPSTLASDGNHPNPHGYDIVAQKWFQSILPTLQP